MQSFNTPTKGKTAMTRVTDSDALIKLTSQMNVLINDDDRLVTISHDTNFVASKESVMWVQFREGGRSII